MKNESAAQRSARDEADEPLRAMARRAPVLLWMAGADGGRTFVNDRWLEFTGRAMHREMGEGWLDAVHPDDVESRVAAQVEAMGAKEPFEAHYRLRRADGVWRWVLDRGVPLGPGEGPEGGYVGACIDVTERQRGEEELHRSREDLRLALAAGHMGTWVWDRRTGKVSRDDNLQALYGLDVGPSSGTYDQWVGLVHPDDRADLLAEVERSVAEGVRYHLEHRIVRPDGTVRWVERRGEAFRDDSGQVAGTRGLVVDITARKAAEAERDRLLVSEREARQAAETSANRLASLQAVTAGLADARTTGEVADVIVSQGAECMGAATGALCLVDDDGEHVRTVRHIGYAASAIQRFQAFSVDADLPASEALRSGEMVLIGSLEERARRYPGLAEVPTRNLSLAAVPVRAHRLPGAVIVLGWREPRTFSGEDRRFLMALGQQAAQALDRAQFYEAEQLQARRQSFLAEASRVLGSSLDEFQTLAQVMRLAVPTAADACAVHLLGDDGLRTLAIAHADPGREAVIRNLHERPWSVDHRRLLEVATSGQPLLVPGVDDAHRRALADGPEHLALLHRLNTQSLMVVPLRSQDQPIGVLVAAMDRSKRRFGAADLPFLEDLAARASSAIANGVSHRARSEIARTLQRSLLPPQVPLIPGLEVAARYNPVGEGVEVGGDFYDVFSAGEGRWGAVIGDVSGKGILASSLTALARYTIRTAARQERTPSAVLGVLNSNILDHEVEERFCTVALALVDQGPEGVSFTLSCGGHPLPLLVDTEGRVTPVGQAGTALGLFGEPQLGDESHPFPPGHTLVLYTDGVVEARSPEGHFADGLLEGTVAACAGLSAAEVAEAIERALREFVGGRPRDDTAVLVLRRPPAS